MVRWRMVQMLVWEPNRDAVGLNWLRWQQVITQEDWSEQQAAQIVLYIAAALYPKANLLRKVLPDPQWVIFGPNTQFRINGQYMVHAMLHVDELSSRLMSLRQVRALPGETEEDLYCPCLAQPETLQVIRQSMNEAKLAKAAVLFRTSKFH